jgi:sigma-E factor negative regulatory protein RseA
MNKVTTRDEQLSAFLDDELEDSECPFFLRRLGSDTKMRAAAFRMALIGDAMRGDIDAVDSAGFRATVSKAVEEVSLQQPDIVAGGARWLRPLVGAAVAASVAVVAVLSLQQTTEVDMQAPAVTVPVAEVGVVGSGSTYTVPEAYSRKAGSPNRLSRYYLVHSEYASMMGGQAPLARMVVAPAETDDTTEEGVVEAEDEGVVETQ